MYPASPPSEPFRSLARTVTIAMTLLAAPLAVLAQSERASDDGRERPKQDSQVLLWPKGEVPEAQGTGALDQPALTIHLPSPESANGCGVIVNPGGGYHVLAADHEGLQVARELNRRGIAAFVLRYRLLPTYQPATALLDGKRAVRYVRHHAKIFGIDPHRIGMLGFSAGGHLTAAVAHWR